jgi:hypothetical protein
VCGSDNSANFRLQSMPIKLSQRRFRSQPLADLRIPLVDLLSTFENAACKDQRDRIFGLRSLALQCCQAQAIVDYSRPVLEVYNTAFTHHVEHHCTKFVLSTIDFMLLRDRYHLSAGESMKHSSESTSTVIYIQRRMRPLPEYPVFFYDAHGIVEEKTMKRYIDVLWRHLGIGCILTRSDLSEDHASNLITAWRALHKQQICNCVLYLRALLYVHQDRYLPISDTSFFLTDDGMFGFAPKEVRLGDIISRQVVLENTIFGDISTTELCITRRNLLKLVRYHS